MAGSTSAAGERPVAELQASVTGGAARGAAWMGLDATVNQAVSLGVFIVLGRLLEPREFGLVASAAAVLWLLRVVVDQGFSSALIQREHLTSIEIDTAFWTAVITGTVVAALTVAAAPLIADLFSQPRLAAVMRVVSVVFVLAALDGTQSALLTRAMDFRPQAIRRLAATFTSAVVAIALAAAGAGVWALVAQLVTFESVSVVLLWSLADWRPSLRFSRTSFRELLTVGASITGIRFLTNVGGNADNVLIGVVIGPLALGYYVIAFRVITVINQVLALALLQVVFSAFSRLRSDPDALNDAFYRSANLVSAVAFPIYAGLAMVGHPLIVAVFGAKWTPSAAVLEALTLAGLVQCQTIFSSQYAIALGKVHNELRWTALVVAAQLVGFAVAVSFGIVAVALSLGIVLAVAWPARLVWLRRVGGLSPREYFRPYPSIVGATVAMAAAVIGAGQLVTDHGSVVRLAIQIPVGVVVYALALLLFARREAMAVLAGMGNLRRSRPR
jgi:O-antigen/teichoic acid export membrane protein